MSLFKKLTASFAALTILSIPAQAAFEDILPEDATYIIQLQQENLSTEGQALFTSMIDFYVNLISNLGGSYNSSDQEIIETFTSSPDIVFNVLSDGSDALALFKMTQSQYDTVKNYTELSYIEKIYQDGYLILTDREEALDTINQANKLSNNNAFTNLKNQLGSKNFLNLYGINIGESITNNLSEYEITDLNTQSLIAFGIPVTDIDNAGLSIADNSDDISLKFVAELNPSANIQLTNTTNFYKNLPNENIIGAANQYLTKDYFYSMTPLAAALITDEVQVAYALQNNQSLLPELTIIIGSEDPDTSSAIKTVIEDGLESVWDDIKDSNYQTIDSKTAKITFENLETTIKESQVTLKDYTTLKQFTVSPKINKTNNPYSHTIDSPDLRLTVSYGFDDDNNFIFSTNPNIDEDYGQGLHNNSKVKSQFQDISHNISYVSIQELSSYLNRASTKVENLDPTGQTDLSTPTYYINELLSPFDKIISEATYNNDKITGTSKIDLDKEQASIVYSNQAFFEKIAKSFDDTELNFLSPKEFEDVPVTAWYYDDVYYLNSRGVVDGYYTGEFRPEQTVNRAEFLKMLITALENEDITYTNKNNFSQSFTDVEYYNWYYDTVQTATKLGAVKGYNDGSFKPANSISRSEAAQIIANVLAQTTSETTNTESPNYQDVKPGSWYHTAVMQMYRSQIMTGKTSTSFAPNDQLNRAEAAKIIRNFINFLK